MKWAVRLCRLVSYWVYTWALQWAVRLCRLVDAARWSSNHRSLTVYLAPAPHYVSLLMMAMMMINSESAFHNIFPLSTAAECFIFSLTQSLITPSYLACIDLPNFCWSGLVLVWVPIADWSSIISAYAHTIDTKMWINIFEKNFRKVAFGVHCVQFVEWHNGWKRGDHMRQ